MIRKQQITEDVSILSFDEQPYFAFLDTPITTIVQQNETVAQIVVSLLLGQINDKEPQSTEGIMLPTTLKKRDSVRTLQ